MKRYIKHHLIESDAFLGTEFLSHIRFEIQADSILQRNRHSKSFTVKYTSPFEGVKVISGLDILDEFVD
jgi:hypothetical protein